MTTLTSGIDPDKPPPEHPLRIVRHELRDIGAQRTGGPEDELVLFVHSGFCSGRAEPRISVAAQLAVVRPFEEIIKLIPSTADIVVLSEHPNIDRKLLLHAAEKRLIIAPVGWGLGCEGGRNEILVAYPGVGEPVRLEKFSFADDETAPDQVPVVRGTVLHLFDLPGVKLCVVNCHEYTHTDLVGELLRLEVDLVVVVTRNRAWRLYDEYAGSDIHRLSCILVINNVADYGGAGVYAPFATLGKSRDEGVSLGGTLFSARGPHETSVSVALPVGRLRLFRKEYEHKNPSSKGKTSPQVQADYHPIDPTEHVKYFKTGGPPYGNVLSSSEAVRTVDLSAAGYQRQNEGLVRIAVAQLRSVSKEEYVATDYHISLSHECPSFLRSLARHLELIEALFGSAPHDKRPPDFLVFPEVFIPLGFEGRLKEFAARWNSIIIAGIEYDPLSAREKVSVHTGKEKEQVTFYKGANRCRTYIPTRSGVITHDYTKLTMSQYDAVASQGVIIDGCLAGHFPLRRGTELIRFTADGLCTFGSLICYDLSHFDLVQAINTGSPAGPRTDPLDLTFVIAHNPFADLYRRCCLADCHRFYQYIALCNVSQFGGSGVFGPLRTKGHRRTLLSAGANAEGLFLAEVDIEGLRQARAPRLAGISREPSGPDGADQKGTNLFQRIPGVYQTRLRFEAISPS